MNRKKFVDIVASVIVFIFLLSGLSKAFDFDVFINQLEKSPWSVVAKYNQFVGALVIFFEILVAILLFVPKIRRVAFGLAFFMFISFTVYIISVYLIDDYKLCTCGAFISSLTWSQHLYLNIVLIILSAWGYFWNKEVHKVLLIDKVNSGIKGI